MACSETIFLPSPARLSFLPHNPSSDINTLLLLLQLYLVVEGSSAIIAVLFQRNADFLSELPPPNHESHSQINRPPSRQMRNWVEKEMWTKSMGIDNRKYLLQIQVHNHARHGKYLHVTTETTWAPLLI